MKLALENEKVQNKVEQIIQDVNTEKNGDYIRSLQSKVKNLRKKINKKYEKVSNLEKKIDRVNSVLSYLEEKNQFVDIQILLESWKDFLLKKKNNLKPDELVDQKGRLNSEIKKLKLIYKNLQEI